MSAKRTARRPAWVCTRCTTPLAKWPGAACPKCHAFAGGAVIPLAEARDRGLPLPMSLLGGETAKASRKRWKSGLAGFDRVLSRECGVVPAASVLVASCAGSGKTTLLAGAASEVAARRHRALYVSAEQDTAALYTLAEKVGGADQSNLVPVEAKTLDQVVSVVQQMRPALFVADSATDIAKQSHMQVPAVVAALHELAHEVGASGFITAHLALAGNVRGGPESEFSVDTVVMMTGDPRASPMRELTTPKNRHGDTTLVTRLRITATGFVDVEDGPAIPRRSTSVGCALGLVVDDKPQLVTIEAMATPRAGSGERRVQAIGCAAARVTTILAILERQGVPIDGDVVVRLADGVTCCAPSLDAGIAGALVSLSRAVPLPSGIVLHGELALDGTIRAGDVEVEAKALGVRLVGMPLGSLLSSLSTAHLRAV